MTVDFLHLAEGPDLIFHRPHESKQHCLALLERVGLAPEHVRQILVVLRLLLQEESEITRLELLLAKRLRPLYVRGSELIANTSRTRVKDEPHLVFSVGADFDEMVA